MDRTSFTAVLLLAASTAVRATLAVPLNAATVNHHGDRTKAAPATSEVFVFHAEIYNASQSDWRMWDWDKVTTVAVWRRILAGDTELVPYAHAHGAKVLLGGIDMDESQLTNATARAAWIANIVKEVQAAGVDGINMDIEHANAHPETKSAITALTCGVKAALVAAGAGIVTFDLAVYPDDTAKGYDFPALAKCLDYLVPMAYDMTGHKVEANSPLGAVEKSVQQYAALGVPASKLVLAFPWYGYDFPCAPARQDSAEHFSRLNALLFTAMAWMFIPAYCFALP